MKTKLLKILRVGTAILLASWSSVMVAFIVSPIQLLNRDIILAFVYTPILIAVLLFVAFLIHKLIDAQKQHK